MTNFPSEQTAATQTTSQQAISNQERAAINRAATDRASIRALTAGVLMALYLALRPYGDGGPSGDADDAATYAAFASPLWVVSHLAGAAGLSAAVWWAVRASGLGRGWASRVACWAGPIGLVGVLLYYGAETFALQVIGRQELAGQDVRGLAAAIREHEVAMLLFGIGLLLLAVAGLAAARCWQQASGPGRWSWAAWPLGIMMALVLPQYYLPVPGRIAFGLVFLAAAILMAVAAGRSYRTAPTS